MGLYGLAVLLPLNATGMNGPGNTNLDNFDRYALSNVQGMPGCGQQCLERERERPSCCPPCMSPMASTSDWAPRYVYVGVSVRAPRLWAHLLSGYVFTIIILTFLYRELSVVCRTPSHDIPDSHKREVSSRSVGWELAYTLAHRCFP